MAPTIRVDDDVYARLKAEAEPFVDTPNSVLRRLLELDDASEPVAAEDDRETRRAAPGTLVPSRDYWVPILRAIEERGGSAQRLDVVEAVGEALGRRLTDADRSRNRSGRVRWRNRTMWVRADLVAAGLLADDSARGIWTITEAGRKYLRDHEL